MSTEILCCDWLPSTQTSSMTELGSFAHLLPHSWKSVVAAWLHEDSPSFDYGGFVVGEAPETATLFGKSKVSLPKTLGLIGYSGGLSRGSIFWRGLSTARLLVFSQTHFFLYLELSGTCLKEQSFHRLQKLQQSADQLETSFSVNGLRWIH
jgi:hypothetical protein